MNRLNVQPLMNLIFNYGKVDKNKDGKPILLLAELHAVYWKQTTLSIVQYDQKESGKFHFIFLFNPSIIGSEK